MRLLGLVRFQVALRRASASRCFSDVPSFDVFQKIKDPPQEGDGPVKGKRRKPTDRVWDARLPKCVLPKIKRACKATARKTLRALFHEDEDCLKRSHKGLQNMSAAPAPTIVTSSCLCGGLGSHFSSAIQGQVLHFHVTKLEGQAPWRCDATKKTVESIEVFLWVGDRSNGLEDLQVATPTRYDPLPAVASLRGEADGASSGLAQKLSRRFNVLVFLSLNVELGSAEMLALQKESTKILGELLDTK